jgi:hypothetical protein
LYHIQSNFCIYCHLPSPQAFFTITSVRCINQQEILAQAMATSKPITRIAADSVFHAASATVPVSVTPGIAVAVACAGNWSMAAMSDGSIYTWGDVPANVSASPFIPEVTQLAAGR